MGFARLQPSKDPVDTPVHKAWPLGREARGPWVRPLALKQWQSRTLAAALRCVHWFGHVQTGTLRDRLLELPADFCKRFMPFHCVRASVVTGALAAAREAGARYLGGGTNLVDRMKTGVERPGRLVELRRIGFTDRRPAIQSAAGRPCPQRGRGEPPARALRLPARGAGGLGGCVRPAAQRRDQRRQPPAAHAVPLLLRHPSALQQARTRRALLRTRRNQPHPCDPGCERRLRGDLPWGYGAGLARAGGGGADAKLGRSPQFAHRHLPSLAGRPARP